MRGNLSEKLKPGKSVVEVKILGKKITRLADLVKIFYLNPQQQKSYFLLNTYQKPDILPYLEIGSEWRIGLISG